MLYTYPHNMSIPERCYHYLRSKPEGFHFQASKVEKIIGGDPSGFLSKMKQQGYLGHNPETGSWYTNVGFKDADVKFHARQKHKRRVKKKPVLPEVEISNPVPQICSHNDSDILANLLDALTAAEAEIRRLMEIRDLLDKLQGRN